MKLTLTTEQSIDVSKITFINGESVTDVKYANYWNHISFTNSGGFQKTLHVSEIKEYVISDKITISPITAIEGKLLAKFASGGVDDLFEFLESKINFHELSGPPPMMMAFCRKVTEYLRAR